MPQDRILAIDGKPTEEVSLYEVGALLQGPKDSQVAGARQQSQNADITSHGARRIHRLSILLQISCGATEIRLQQVPAPQPCPCVCSRSWCACMITNILQGLCVSSVVPALCGRSR